MIIGNVEPVGPAIVSVAEFAGVTIESVPGSRRVGAIVCWSVWSVSTHRVARKG